MEESKEELEYGEQVSSVSNAEEVTGGAKVASKGRRIAGWGLTGVHLIAAILLVVVLLRFPVLPGRYMALVFGGMAVLFALSTYLLHTGRKRFVCGAILTVLLIAMYLVGFGYLEKTRSTLADITDIDKEMVLIDNMVVMVRESDAAQRVEDTLSYRYGIQYSYEYPDSLAVVAHIEKDYGATLQVSEYENFSELGQALLAGELDAIILNESFVEMLEEYEEGFEAGTRVLQSFSFETELSAVDITATPTPVVTLEPIEDLTPVPEPTGEALVDPQGTVTPEPSITGEPEVSGSPTPTPTPKEYYDKNPANTPTPVPTRPPVNMPTRTDNKDVTGNYFVVYCSGIDRAGAITTKSRSDVNIIMVVNPLTKKILLVNTPRDAYVTIPGISGGQYDKLTHAGIYGVKYSMKTLENVYGIKIDYYLRVNFTSVEKFVDLLGGVDVFSMYEFTGRGTHFKKGYNHLNGAEALKFARERYAFASGDNQRGKNQMELIKAVIAKMTSTEALMNFGGIMDAVRSNFQTDLTMDQLTSLVRMQLNDPAQWHVETYAVTGTGTSAYCYSYRGSKLYVMRLKQSSINGAIERINAVISGQ